MDSTGIKTTVSSDQLSKGQSTNSDETDEYSDLIAQSNGYDITQEYQLGAYIDAKDQVSKWCCAQITDIDTSGPVPLIQIHFEGWGTKYDDTITINSPKIAPFRQFTSGYTGQPNCAYRDFKINESYHNQILSKVQEIVQTDFECLRTAQEVNQFLRGELYFYVDSIISISLYTMRSDFPIIYNFINEVMIMVIRWVSLFPEKYQKAYYDTLKHPKLYLIDSKAAVSRCGYELIDILWKCFGKCSRCNAFFDFEGNVYLFEGGSELIPYSTEMGKGLMFTFINQFNSIGGFEVLLNFINEKNESLKLKNTPVLYSWKILESLV